MSRNGDVVVFIVGPRGYGERMEGNISDLCQASPVFHAMLQGPLREMEAFIRIEDCDSRAFSCLLAWIHDGKIRLRSVPTALSLLYLCHKYLVPDLIPHILLYLIHNTADDTVLPVIQAILLYYRHPATAPSAPPAVQDRTGGGSRAASAALQDRASSGGRAAAPVGERAAGYDEPINNAAEERSVSIPVTGSHKEQYEKLMSICLSIVDRSGTKVLDSEEWEDISRDLLEIILSRNTLRIQSESEVARALERWGNVQARRQGCPRGELLGNTVYLVRYLTMSVTEFKRWVAGRGLLTTQEEQSLLFCLIRPGSWLPAHLDAVRDNLAASRRWRPSKTLWWRGPKQKPHIIAASLAARSAGVTGGVGTRGGHAGGAGGVSGRMRAGSCDLSCSNPTERNFTVTEKIFLCLACLFD